MLVFRLFALLLLSVASHLAEGAPPLLSTTSAGYSFVEKVQQQYCVKRPSHNCSFDVDDCRTKSKTLWKEMFKEEAPEDYIDRQCNRVSTKYELPGMFTFLNGLYADVFEAAADAGMPTINRVHLGSLPIKDVNARVLPPDPDLGHFLFFNIKFIEFASELAKIAALAIPMTESDDQISIDTSQKALEKRIDDTPELTFLFVNRLMYFLNVEGMKPSPPPQNIQPILSRYQQGIELFAMAHEYAHLALDHSGGSTQLEGVDVSAGELQISGVAGDWAQELEADFHAAKILQALVRRRLAGKESHLADYLMTSTPQFYFLARRIVRDADSLFSQTLAAPSPDPRELELLTVAGKCILTEACKLRETLVHEGRIPAGHPHPAIRQQFAKLVLSKEPTNQDDMAMQQLAVQMLGNIDYLWSQMSRKLRLPEAAPLLEAVRRTREEKRKGGK